LWAAASAPFPLHRNPKTLQLICGKGFRKNITEGEQDFSMNFDACDSYHRPNYNPSFTLRMKKSFCRGHLVKIRFKISQVLDMRSRTEVNKADMVNKAIFALSIGFAFVAVGFADAQQPSRILRVGYLTANSSAVELPRIDAFRQGLHALGYIEGQNLAIEYRYTDGKFERLSNVASELVQLNVDVLVAVTTNAALAAKNATRTIPIFFIGVSDPIGAGLVDSLARPGGNITGLTNIAPVLSGKRLELLKETVPKLSRVAVLWDPKNPGSTPQWKESELAARELDLRLHSMRVSRVDYYESAFKEATKAHSTALAVTLNPLANANQKRVVDLAAKNRLPAIYARKEFVDAGGLMSYGPTFAADGRDAARLVDKILKGAKPADLPVEQPTKFELMINLKTAKTLGLTIPPVVLFRAERVIR
jgi:putative tryptophan/tyrosine transport system substrate-binding protein